MKKIYIISALVSFIVFKINAQDKPDSSLKLEDFQLTNAPGFSLLDVSPSSIERPVTTKAFSASVINSLNQSTGIPQNYAVEFTPFWFFKHPKLSALKYYGLSDDGNAKNKAFSSVKFLSVSFALISNPSGTTSQLAAHNLSFGFRTTILKLYTKKTRTKLSRVNEAWVTALRVASRNLSPSYNANPTANDADILEAKVQHKHYGDSVKKYLQDKPWFSFDAASALNLAFNNNNYSSNRVNRIGIWANANLSIDISNKNPGSGKNYFNVYAIGRYLQNSDSLNTDGSYLSINFIDYGAKAELEFNNLSFAYEYIRRATSKPGVPNTFKSVGLIKYKIKDGLFLTGAFGQNFTANNNLITVLGINWGISNGTEKVNTGK